MAVFPEHIDNWMLENAPFSAVVISSRARLARNLPNIPFAPRANETQLKTVAAKINQSFEHNTKLGSFEKIILADLSSEERSFLRESHLISAELERGGTGRMVYLNKELDASIMINEEDHFRLTTLASGFRLNDVYERLLLLEREVEKELELAFSDEFGYLTACPTNTGTGLRLSVMLHLPALAIIGQVEDAFSPLGTYGLTVRGPYGEHSEQSGDIYQISNEVTLGKSERQILEILEKLVGQVINHELRAREALYREARDKVEDAVYRAMGLLMTARRIDSSEAVSLLSKARLGIGQDWGVPLTHPQLSRLFVTIQPGHLQYLNQTGMSPEARDAARANYLRTALQTNGGKAQNN